MRNRKCITYFLFFITVIFRLAICFGNEPEKPERIISTVPNFTEILFSLNLGDSVAGVSNFCHYPAEAKQKEKIGGYLNPNLEKIISLQPDLVIIPDVKSNTWDPLKKTGISVLELRNETIDDVIIAVHKIAEACGVTERGRKLADKIQSDVKGIKKEYANKPPVSVLVVVGREPGSVKNIYAAAPGTFLDELVNLCGGKNILTEQPALYPKISKESIIGLNPEVIIDTTLAGINPTTKTLNAAERAWDRLSSVNAVKNNRIHVLKKKSITILGPRVTETASLFTKIIHPRKQR